MGRAGIHAGAGGAPLLRLHGAEAALVHGTGLGVAHAHLVGAGAHAVQTTDAAALIHAHDAVGAHMGRTRRAHARTGRVLAVHALQGHRFHPHVRIGSRLGPLVADEVLVGLQVVLSLARRAAGVAADALSRVDEHSVACHHAPAFRTVTMVSCRSGAP